MREKNFQSTRGFTLVELMVVLAIFAIVTSITLVKQPRFNSKISLDLLTHNVSLVYRQAQSFALGTKSFTSQSSSFFPGYGIFVRTSDPRSLILFADTDSNRQCDAPECGTTGTEFVEKFSLPQSGPVQIKAVSARDSFGTQVNKDSITVVYRSPKPEAIISCSPSCVGSTDIEVHLGTSDYDSRVVVWKTGQVSVPSQ